MKRVLAMLLAVATLAALLCGCASEGNKETQQTQQPQATEVAAEENVTEKPATATGTPKEIVETLVGDSLDLSAYEVVNEDEDLISYCNLDLYTSFPYEITLYDMKFQLDGVSTYQDVLDNGWTFDMPETADAYYSYSHRLRGADGEYLRITLTNPKDEAIPMEEAYLTKVDGDIENGATFTLGTITEKSSPADVIQAFGTPYQVVYTETSGLRLLFHAKSDYSIFSNEVQIYFNKDGIITEVMLQCELV